MTWEDTITMIRQKPEYAELVEKAYFDEDLVLNLTRFKKSEEYKETLKFLPSDTVKMRMLDVGSGNGISAVAFAQLGFEVHAVEPDPSNTVGAGAIRILKQHYQLDNLHIYESLAEEIQFESNSFDIVYVRQAMHHANDLDVFIAECLRVLKPKGRLLTIRDHVVFDAKDKVWFLEMHPLHKFYGGENAYTAREYKDAFAKANGKIIKELKYYDSIINYYPLSCDYLEKMKNDYKQSITSKLTKKFSFLGRLPGLLHVYFFMTGKRASDVLDEHKVPGRMYSYIVTK